MSYIVMSCGSIFESPLDTDALMGIVKSAEDAGKRWLRIGSSYLNTSTDSAGSQHRFTVVGPHDFLWLIMSEAALTDDEGIVVLCRHIVSFWTEG